MVKLFIEAKNNRQHQQKSDAFGINEVINDFEDFPR